MSSAASAPSTNNNSHALKRNSGDIGWDYGVLVDPNNLNVIKCIFCPMIVKVGIYRLKCHIAVGDVKPCPSAPDVDIAKCKKVIDDSKKAKRERIQEKEEVRDAVDIEGAPDNEDTTIVVPDDNGLDDVGESSARKVGPMDKYTLPMDPSLLANTKVVHQ
jgi:hypothetical protein